MYPGVTGRIGLHQLWTPISFGSLSVRQHSSSSPQLSACRAQRQRTLGLQKVIVRGLWMDTEQKLTHQPC